MSAQTDRTQVTEADRVRVAQRYGSPSRTGRWLTIACALLFAALGVSWVVWAGLGAADPVTASVVTYSVRSPHRIDLRVQVSRPAGMAATCQVDAEASDHAAVGQTVIHLPASAPSTSDVLVSIRTARTAVTGVVDDCESQ